MSFRFRSPPLALRRFRALPLRERAFVWARWFSAPLEAVVARAPSGRIADVGCGHGLVAALLAEGRGDRHIVAVDPDERKTRWAEQALGSVPNIEVRTASTAGLLENQEPLFDAVVLCDVLYLFNLPDRRKLVSELRQLLRPGGTLLLKDAVAGAGWKSLKGELQEKLMVYGVGKTRSSGAVSFTKKQEMSALLSANDFHVTETVDLSTGFTTPHMLWVARAESKGMNV